MQKTIMIIFTAFFIYDNGYSQIAKNNWMVGGSAGLSRTDNNISSLTQYKSTTLLMSPNLGYFIWDKFVAGARFSVLLIKNDYPASSGGTTISYATRSQLYNLGPFARYYVLSKDRRANVFFEGVYQYQLRKDVSPTSDSKQAANILAINGGPVIYFNSSVGIEFTIGYSSIKYNGFSGRNNTIQTNIGLQIHLQKDE